MIIADRRQHTYRRKNRTAKSPVWVLSPLINMPHITTVRTLKIPRTTMLYTARTTTNARSIIAHSA